MDANRAPDNHIPAWGAFHSHTALDRAVFGVRVQLQQEQQQQEEQQQEMLPARRSLEVGSS
jgi:hypothetical protein